MSVDSVATGPRTRTYRAGWGWLLLTTVSRAYLVFMGALAACALLPMLLGLSGAVIQSGSMGPKISTGDVVLSQALPADAPAPLGRVITFRAPAGSAHSGNVLHRLVAVNDDGSVVTAGDANANKDSTSVARRDIISRASLLIPWVGLPAFWVTTRAYLALGIWALLTMGALMIGAVDAVSRPRPANRPPAKKAPESPGGSSRPGKAAEDLVKAVRTRGPHGESISSIVNRIRVVPGPAAVALVSLVTAGALATAPLGQAAASFTATTTSTGNLWGTAGPATKLAFTTNPSSSTGGIAFTTQPVVAVRDAGDNTVTVSSAPVTLSITTPAGAVLSCSANPTNAVAGVATFAGCRIDHTGTYTLTAASTGLTNAVSASFTITVGPATQLGFTTSPSNTAVNAAFGTQPVVAIQDAGGNTRTSSSATVTLTITTPAGATLTCTTNPRSTSSGVATFSNCSIDTAGTYTLTASASGLTSAVSAGFTITVVIPTRLAFTTSPSGSTGGVAFPTQPRVAVQDASGNTATTSTAPVTLSITTPAGAVLSCSANPTNAVAGVATFAGCRIDHTGTYTLTAASTGLTNALSASFTITVGPATQLGFTTSPSNTAVNTAFGTQPVVAIQDAGGNTRTSSSATVTLAITTPAGATLTCTTNPRSTSSGVATFAGCRIDRPGTYTLTATASGLTAAVSAGFTITAGPATKLAFITSPSGSTGGVAFPTQPVVAVQDASGNTTTGTNAVTLSITTPAGAVLTCTANPMNAVAGVATFAGCRVDKFGTYTLTASASGLTSAVSASFTITVGSATQLGFTTSPSNTARGIAFATQPRVAVQDAGGNTVTSSTAPVTMAVTAPAGGAILTCAANPKSASAGVAIFSGCSINTAGTYTLTATASGLTAAVSAVFTIS